MTEAEPSATRRALGVVALVPALIALVVTYVWPTAWTVNASLTRRNVFTDSGGSAGRNWGPIWSPLGHSLAYAALVSVGPLVAVLVVAPLLAAAARGSGRPVRNAVRVVLAVATVSVAPVAIAVAWRDDHRLPTGAGAFDGSWPGWIIGFALAVGVAATAYLAASRRSGPVLALIAVCTVLAVSVQDFTMAFFRPSTFRPSTGTPAPMNLLYAVLVRFADLGRGSALAVALMAVLAVLGLVATLALVVSRLRVEPAEAAPAPSPGPVAPVRSSPVPGRPAPGRSVRSRARSPSSASSDMPCGRG